MQYKQINTHSQTSNELTGTGKDEKKTMGHKQRDKERERARECKRERERESVRDRERETERVRERLLTQTASRIDPISMAGSLRGGGAPVSGGAHTLLRSRQPSSSAMERPWNPGLS